MSTTAPSAYQLTRVVSEAMQTLETLRTEHGLVIDDDETLLAALSEKNVPVERILTLLVRAGLEAKANAAAAEQRIRDLTTRRDRFEHQEERYRETVRDVMQALDMRSFKTAEFTLSIAPGKPKVIITDESKLTDAMVVIKVVRTPHKAAIQTAIEDRAAWIEAARNRGEEVPPELEGVMISQAPPTLTVRTK